MMVTISLYHDGADTYLCILEHIFALFSSRRASAVQENKPVHLSLPYTQSLVGQPDSVAKGVTTEAGNVF